MKDNTVKFLIKNIILIVTISFVLLSDNTAKISLFICIISLVMLIYLLYCSKHNYRLYIYMFMISYFIFSIIIGEYIFPSLVYGDKVLKTEYYYSIAIKNIFILITILSLYVDFKKIQITRIVPKRNGFVFLSIYLVMIYALIFGINRESSTSYITRETPLYEYCSLLFLFAWYYSGNIKIFKKLLIIFAMLYALQGFYYGDRASAVQLGLIILLVMFKHISVMKITYVGILGILINVAIGIYRTTTHYSFVEIIETLASNGVSALISDTANAAYYSSVTLIAFSEITDLRMVFFKAFLNKLFFGIHTPEAIPIEYVSKNYFANSYGGILPIYFYFWIGFLGVILIGFYLVWVLNRSKKINSSNNKTGYLALFIMYNIATLPRWLLYSPYTLFRSGVIFFSLVFTFSYFMNYITVSKEKVLNT